MQQARLKSPEYSHERSDESEGKERVGPCSTHDSELGSQQSCVEHSTAICKHVFRSFPEVARLLCSTGGVAIPVTHARALPDARNSPGRRKRDFRLFLLILPRNTPI